MSSNLVNQRVNFASVKNPMPYPDFLDVQLKSFKDFLQLDTPPELRKNDGLYKVFSENFPIADTRNNFVLEFLDYYIDPPRYTIEECLERGLTYSVPLKAKLKLYCTDPDHEDFDTVIQDVFLGPIPYMTDNGTFIINGAERVVVSQLHRSPGVFFGSSIHANGTQLYSARIIPFKGSWIEFATDINNVMYAYIDRKKKLPVTTLLRAIGFETALPMYALVLQTACQRRIRNFSLLPALDSVLPAMDALLSDPENVIDGFLAAGHVCAVTGIREYESFSRKWQTPVAVTGFEPSDLLYGILWCVRRLEANQPGVDNAYSRVVELSGNEQALRRIRQVFERSDQEWRGLGMLKGSGFKINEAYKQYDAVKRFQLKQEQSVPDRCQAGKILSGKISPHGCPLFGQACTPNHPLGAPMVSSEGTCAAYYRYKRNSYDRNPVKASLSVTRYSL